MTVASDDGFEWLRVIIESDTRGGGRGYWPRVVAPCDDAQIESKSVAYKDFSIRIYALTESTLHQYLRWNSTQ